jgi:hypothetical protein
MTDVRLQREHAHTLEAAARAWAAAEAGKVNIQFRELREGRLRGHNAAFDRVRDELVLARAERPRDEARIEALQSRLRGLKARPLPSMADLEEQRLAAVNALDQVIAPVIRDIRNRAARNELDTRLVWSAESQSFHLPAEAA